MRVAQWLGLVLVGLTGCGDDVTAVDSTPPPCAPGGLVLPSGDCIFPGLRPEDCAAGFIHDGDRGCLPILPASCPPGLMAVPGDESCHEVAPCGEGPWGDIPLEPTSQHVDGSYAGTDSDGSPERPWQHIQDGVDAAAAGAIVAVAAGSYLENVEVAGKAVRIWGRCPSQVELVGTGSAVANLEVRPGASNTEVHGIAVTGGSFGIATSDVTEVVFANLWIHDTGHVGLDAESPNGDSRVWVRDSLIEGAVDRGVMTIGAELNLEGTVVRDTMVHPSLGRGYGAVAQPAPGGVPGKLVVVGSVLERNASFGIAALDGELVVQGCVVRDTGPGPEGYGVGIGVFIDSGPASLQLIDSAVTGNLKAGVTAEGATATIDGAVITDTLPDVEGMGAAVAIQPNQDTGATAPVTIRRSLLERNAGASVVGIGVDLTVDRTIIRDTLPSSGTSDTWPGRGLLIQADPMPLVPGSLTLMGSLVEHSWHSGVVVMGAVATIDATVVRLTQLADDGLGDGLLMFRKDGIDTSATVTNTHIDESERAAITLFGASLTVTQARSTCNAIDIDGEAYDSQTHAVDDQGDNLCGCPEATQACEVVTLGLEPSFD
jgi:hypothetical protein